jgi:2-methylcitrate dehydratase PrpD
MEKIIDQLIAHCQNAKYESLDPETIEAAKLRLIDVIGCAIAGSRSSSVGILLDVLSNWGGREEASVFGSTKKFPVALAAMVNSVMSRAYDYEVSGLNIEGNLIASHISGTTVPTAVTMAESLGASGKDLILALVVADDITSRIHAASDYNLDSGWDCTGTVNAFGAVVIAARFMKLTNEELLNAMGIVVNQLAGSFQCIYDGVHAFVLPQGSSAKNGIFSAQLAKKGFTGVRDFLFSRFGFFRLYGGDLDVEILTKNLGRKYYADVRFKPYPSCGGNDAAINCAMNIRRRHEINPAGISEVILSVTPWVRDSFVGQQFRLGPFPFGSACFNLAYTVASALIRGNSDLENFTDEMITMPEVVNLTKKVKIQGNLSAEKGRRATGVTVLMDNGDVLEEYMDAPHGDPLEKPLSRSVIEDKFRRNVAFAKYLKPKIGESLLETLNLVEHLKDCHRICELMRE